MNKITITINYNSEDELHYALDSFATEPFKGFLKFSGEGFIGPISWKVDDSIIDYSNGATNDIDIGISETKIRHLRYHLMVAGDCGENRHPKTVMKELGITYQHSTPQSMGDQWWFWNCEGNINDLPEYLTELGLDPMEQIGYGLSKEDAEKIRNYIF